jgi:hypothetical protein
MYNAWLRMGGSCDTAMSLLTNMGESNMNNDGRLTPLGARLVDRFLDSLSFLRLCPSLVGVFLIDDSGRRLSWVDEEGILGMVLEKSVIINEMGEDQEEEGWSVVQHDATCNSLFRRGGGGRVVQRPRLVCWICWQRTTTAQHNSNNAHFPSSNDKPITHHVPHVPHVTTTFPTHATTSILVGRKFVQPCFPTRP